MSSSGTLRIRLLWGFILLMAIFYITRLYIVQIVNGQTYRERAEHQYLSPANNAFDRGSIYFSNKDGSLISVASLKTGFTLAVNPKLIVGPEQDFELLHPLITTLDKNDFIAKTQTASSSYQEIENRIAEDTAQQITNLKLKGVTLTREKWRYNPAGSLASQVIGFVGNNGSALTGQYGLERYYDDVLSRTGPGQLYSNFFADIFSNIESTQEKGTLEGDIVSSIEPNVQIELEEILRQITDQYKSDKTGGVIIDPKTGEIYAMGTNPSFDPNFYNLEKNPAVFSNPLVESVFEMGSIIKPLTMAAGIDSGTVTPSTTYDDKGFLILNTARIANYDGKGRGIVDMQTVLNQSLNTGAAFVALKMGNDLFSKYMLNYGLGEETGIDLPNEIPGLVNNLSSARDIEHATAAFGQGIALTPIATVRALSSLANGGFLITPQVVKTINYDIGGFKNISPDPGTRILKQATSEEITRMLVAVYDNALLNGKVKMKDYSIAAKTGTAQIADPVTKGYFKDRYLHSFFGYFPAYNPKFLIFLYTYNPKEVQYASETLTMPFVTLTRFLINYYNIPPDR